MSDKISQMSDETEYLLSSPANAKELLESIAEANAGKFVEYDPLTEERLPQWTPHSRVATQSADPGETNKRGPK